MKIVFLLGLLPILFMTFGTAFAVLPDDCLTQMHEGHRCFSYQTEPNHIPSTSQHPPFENTNPSLQALNWVMDIFAPDGTCNVSGVTLQSGTCTAPSIVLSDSDFSVFKTNISVLAVEHIQNSAMSSQAYCPVAAWTWGTQDVLFHNKYNMTMVIPPSCFTPNAVPEFPVGLVIFSLIFGGVVALGRMVDGHWIWN